jgi:PTH2 family peptidyl-tRNA hydrolase
MADTKQVIVMRKLYPDEDGKLSKIRTGKMVAQGGHSVIKVFSDRGKVILGQDDQFFWVVPITESMKEWLQGSYTKICVSVNTEEELLAIYNKAKEAGIPCSLVKDNGLTEFHGVPTYTAVSIGPDYAEAINQITGNLPLL